LRSLCEDYVNKLRVESVEKKWPCPLSQGANKHQGHRPKRGGVSHHASENKECCQSSSLSVSPTVDFEKQKESLLRRKKGKLG